MRASKVSTPGGTAISAWLPLDPYVESGSSDGLFVKVTGSVVYTLEVTGDDIFDPTVTPNAFPTGVAAFTAATTSQAGVLAFAARAIRINQASGAGTVTLTAVVRGIQ